MQVPHIGWNTLTQRRPSGLLADIGDADRVYFVHSYRAVPDEKNRECVLATCEYGGEFVAAVNRGNMYATQFHPEKSGGLGLGVIDAFLSGREGSAARAASGGASSPGLSKRVIACLDVRANDQGDLVVTKGDQYDVRESTSEDNAVRNLGKPVELAQRYFDEGADEVTFLNITGFRYVFFSLALVVVHILTAR
jgi:glutamine amidotransferase/cyclase